MNKDEQYEYKKNSSRKIQRDTYLLKTIALIPNDGIEVFSFVFLGWFAEA